MSNVSVSDEDGPLRKEGVILVGERRAAFRPGAVSLPSLSTLLIVAIVCIPALLAILRMWAVSQTVGFFDCIVRTDFRAYYTAGRMVLGGAGSQLYDLSAQYSWQAGFVPELAGFKYLMAFLNPPLVALVMAPLAALPVEASYLLWFVVNVVLLALVSREVLKAMDVAGKWWRILALAVTVFFPEVHMVFIQGQLSFLMTLALLVSWRKLRAGRDMEGGLALALLLVKPQLLLLPALVLLWKRRFRAVAGLGIGGMVFAVLSVLVTGLDGAWRYVTFLWSASNWGNAYAIHPQDMFTWRGFLHLLWQTDDASDVQLWWLLGVAIAIVLVYWGWKGKWNATTAVFDLRWALLIIAAFFVSPHAYGHDLTVLIVSLSLIARYCIQCRGQPAPDRSPIFGAFLVYGLFWLSYLAGSPEGIRLTVVFMLLALPVLVWLIRREEEASTRGEGQGKVKGASLTFF